MSDTTSVSTTCTCIHSPMRDHTESLVADDGVILKCAVESCSCQFIVGPEDRYLWRSPPGWMLPDDDF